MEEVYINHVMNSFENGTLSKISTDDKDTDSYEILNNDGMSGKYTRHLYNNLLNIEDARYLEIGVWRGSSSCAAMYKNNATVLCIDNWSEFLDISTAENTRNTFTQRTAKFKGNNNFSFLEHNCFTLDTRSLGKFNIYLYDGPHKKDEHYRALLHYYDNLDDVFIFICDDWNWNDVRNGTYLAIKKLQLEILYEHEIKLNQNDLFSNNKETWWNGVYVAVLKKNSLLDKSTLSLSSLITFSELESDNIIFDAFNVTRKINEHEKSNSVKLAYSEKIDLCSIGVILGDSAFTDKNWENYCDNINRNNNNINILEIGSTDGKSINSIVKNLMTNVDSTLVCIHDYHEDFIFFNCNKACKFYNIFCHNVILSKNNNIKVIREDPLSCLTKMNASYEKYFDVIYINSFREPKDVLIYLLYIFSMLKFPGTIIVNNYRECKTYVDVFLNLNKEKMNGLIIDSNNNQIFMSNRQ